MPSSSAGDLSYSLDAAKPHKTAIQLLSTVWITHLRSWIDGLNAANINHIPSPEGALLQDALRQRSPLPHKSSFLLMDSGSSRARPKFRWLWHRY